MVHRITEIYRKFSRRSIFSAYLSTFTVLVILGFISQLELTGSFLSLKHILSLLSVFDRFIVELCILLLLGILLVHRHVAVRIFLYGITSFYIAVYTVQLTSFYQGRELLSRLAIDNMNHIGLLINLHSISGILFLLLICLALPFLVEKKPLSLETKQRLSPVVVSILLAAALLQQSSRWLPQSIIAGRDTILESNYLLHTSPIAALHRILFLEGSSRQQLGAVKLHPFVIETVRDFGFHYNPDNPYPLIKESIYTTAPPFETVAVEPAKPNIIVFFTEGVSARTIHAYGGRYADLTPNLDNFAASSMMVENYFNQTGATYRGLHGQLCSLYPTYGGIGGWQTNYKNLPETSYFCLSNVMNRNDYATIFLDAHRAYASQVDEMMHQLDFDQVLTAEILSRKYLNNARPQTSYSLSDGQFFRSLVGFLKDREKQGKINEPFFMALYNLGTHAFKELTPDGKKYRDGKNPALDTIHNLDHSFGMFWEYFKDSPYASNTIVILTADHCHYPENPFVEAFDEPGYQPFFVDRIPLIIHDPTRTLPEKFDARNATSIDFTPSLIHYLGLDNHKNPFMGSSIYERPDRGDENFGLNSYGEELYLIGNDKIHKMGFSFKHRVQMEVLNKFIARTKYLEVRNKLWDPLVLTDQDHDKYSLSLNKD